MLALETATQAGQPWPSSHLSQSLHLTPKQGATSASPPPALHVPSQECLILSHRFWLKAHRHHQTSLGFASNPTSTYCLLFSPLCKDQDSLQPFLDSEGAACFHSLREVICALTTSYASSVQQPALPRRELSVPQMNRVGGVLDVWRRRDMVESVAWVRIHDFKGASATVKQTLSAG